MTEPDLLGELHFWIGCGAIIAGFTAFAARKGGRLHRGAGVLFVISMGLLALSGFWLSLAREIVFTVFLSAISFHALVTGWAAALGGRIVARRINQLAPVVSIALTLGAIVGGVSAANSPSGALNGLPPAAFFVLAGVSALISGLDCLYLRARAPKPQARLTRHLWRMGFSFFLAVGIFFFGNNHVLPDALRTPWALSAPVLAVVLWTVFYAVRTRFGPVSGDAGRRTCDETDASSPQT